MDTFTTVHCDVDVTLLIAFTSQIRKYKRKKKIIFLCLERFTKTKTYIMRVCVSIHYKQSSSNLARGG